MAASYLLPSFLSLLFKQRRLLRFCESVWNLPPPIVVPGEVGRGEKKETSLTGLRPRRYFVDLDAGGNRESTLSS